MSNLATGLSQMPYGSESALGVRVTPDEAERNKFMHQQRIVEAVATLARALELRRDVVLMGEVREHIRKLRDEGAALLDELQASAS